MKRYVRFALLFLLCVLVCIQFIHPAKNQSDDQSHHIVRAFPVPDTVQALLRTACYDCHSNYTVYPWYAQLQPVGFWLDHHVEEGREELNFSEFASYPPRRQYRALKEIGEQVREGEMPLSSYTWIHRDAILPSAQRNMLIDWATALQDSLKVHYPLDSLVRKRR